MVREIGRYEKSKVASNTDKFLRYYFIFISNFSLPCCVIKQNKLKYNFSKSLYLLQVANVTGNQYQVVSKFPKVLVMESNFSHGSRKLVRVCESYE